MSGPDIHNNYEFTSDTFEDDLENNKLVANKNCDLAVEEGLLILTSEQAGSTPGVMLPGTFTLEMGVRYVLRVTGRNIDSPNNPFLWIGKPPINNISSRNHTFGTTSSTVTATIVPAEKLTDIKIGVLMSEVVVGSQMEISRILFFSEIIEDPYELTTNLIKSVDQTGVLYVNSTDVAANDQLTVSDQIVSADIYTNYLYGLDSSSDPVITIDSSDVNVHTDLIVSSDVTANLVKQYDPADLPNTYILLPPGCILPFASTTVPDGYLLCDGSAVSRTTYSALFTVVSTTYGGGDGSTTFNVPNLVGRFIYGANGVATIGGSTTQTLTTSNMPAHSHTITITDPGHTHAMKTELVTSGTSSTVANNDEGTGGIDGSSATTGISASASTEGSGSSFSIMNPYMTMLYIIKY